MYGVGSAGFKVSQMNRSITKKTENSQASYSDIMMRTAQKKESNRTQKESVVDEYKKRHPEDASHVDSQVKAGKAVRDKNGAEHVSTEDMTMEEYKQYFNYLLSTIPRDSTRIYDQEIVSISDKGWEQMKNDSDYEAWVLGYFVEDRSVRNPFFGWGGNSGIFVVEEFGASIEEHHGVGFSKSALKATGKKDDDEESWWTKRHRRMEELLLEQAEKMQKRNQAAGTLAQQEFRNRQLEEQQRLQSFLTGKMQEGQEQKPAYQPVAIAAAAYEGVISSYNSSIAKSGKY